MALYYASDQFIAMSNELKVLEFLVKWREIIFFYIFCFLSDPKLVAPNGKKKKKRVLVPLRILETALAQCEKFLAEREHEDIDKPDNEVSLR